MESVSSVKNSPTTTNNTQAFTPDNTNTTQIPSTESTNIPKDAVGHIVDVTKIPAHNQEDTGNFVIFPNTSYFVYMSRALRNLFMTLIFDWSTAILHPLSFLTLITLVPILLFSLFVLEIFLRIGFYFGLENYINDISRKWGKGFSTVNWWNPNMFSDETSKIVQDGIIALDQSPPEPLKEEALDDDITIQTRNFNLDMAELLLFISSIVYERNDKLVREAHDAITALTDDKKDSDNLTAQDFELIYKQFFESEVKIREQASSWGMKFTSLSELNSLGGPFSGMFYSEEHNFIVVVFKGTTPTDFEDFIVDLMLQRVDARSFLFGEVHEGFYSSLFPQAENSSARANSASPYLTIIRAIRAKAADILNKRNNVNVPKKINVWITGHSLGAALATLFFARCLKSPEDLGPNCILRDGYVFGSPAMGDNDFAAEFASYSNRPFDQQSILWRVIDDTDIITRLHGFEDSSIRRVINKRSLLNYVHVGEGIRFFQDGKRPESSKKLFSSGKAPVIIERFDTEEEEKEKISEKFKKDEENFFIKEAEIIKSVASTIINKPFEHMKGSPLIFMEKLLPVFFRNHLPARYFEAMQKARKYFDKENVIKFKESKDPVEVDTVDDNSSSGGDPLS